MSDDNLETEYIRSRYVLSSGDPDSYQRSRKFFNRWLSELIRSEREQAWDECLSEMPLDLDWKIHYGDQNPYRK